MARYGESIGVLMLLLSLAACEAKKSDDSDADTSETPKQTIVSGQQVIPDENSGAAGDSDDIPDEDDADPVEQLPLVDLRPEASTAFKFPTTFLSQDPRTFTPSGKHKAGLGKLNLNFTNSNVLVPPDGRTHAYAACKYPIAAPGHVPVTVTVDGAIGEWPAGSIIAVDRAGDGPGGASSADLRAVRWAQDATYYYMAFEVDASWANPAWMRLDFIKLLLPTDTTTNPATQHGAADRFYTIISNGSFFVYDDSVSNYVAAVAGTGAGQLDYQLAVAGKYIELKIERAAVDSLMDGEPMSVVVSAWLPRGALD